MESTQYIKAAIRTESTPASLDIEQILLHAILSLSVQTSELVDLVKRKLYYGKEIDQTKFKTVTDAVNGLVSFLGQEHVIQGVNAKPVENLSEVYGDLPEDIAKMDLKNINIRLLHAALGCFTESGELIDSIKRQYETGLLDKVNFGEEVGDIEWYQAIGFDETGVTEASCREKNIAKLKSRYPEKFSNEAAINRDTAAERAVLEGAEIKPAQGILRAATCDVKDAPTA